MAIVLGITMSAYASACLLKDGKVVALIGEERLDRIKFSASFPRLAIQKVMGIGGVSPSQIDLVAVGTRCGIFDSNQAQEKEYRLSTKLVSFFSKFVPVSVLETSFLRQLYIFFVGTYTRYLFFKRYLPFFESLGISRDKTRFFDHHSCHAAAAYFCHPWSKDEEVLVFTCDGNGDGICASVSVGKAAGFRTEVEISSIHSIGGLYSRVCRFLGMAPWHDEYKVMGLAPWGKKHAADEAVARFRKLWSVQGLKFRNECGRAADSLVSYLNKSFRNKRFDVIAYALQDLTETLTTRWVRNNISHFGISKIALCGGVFMNIKANQKIGELKEVQGVYAFPAASDESISLGAALLAAKALGDDLTTENPLKTIYLGEEIDTLKRDLIASLDRNRFEVTKPENINEAVAELLMRNEIVARCSGRMEYGPRALGNRSILAHPSHLPNVERINRAIKQRDFWMPFGASILDCYAEKYLKNGKGIDASYMIFSFDTQENSRAEIIAAIHQADHTIRPQVLKRMDNPSYYDLIEKFSEKSGVGALLNTSLNLHGEPMVNSPQEALRLLMRSELNHLVVDEYLISKRTPY